MDQLVRIVRERGVIPPRTIALTIDDGFEDAYTHAYPVLREFGVPATLFLPVDLIGLRGSSRGANGLPQGRFLSWDQVREMIGHGLDFGSHTLGHTSLTKLTLAEVAYQLERSKSRLEEELGRPVSGLSYPYGRFSDFNLEVERLAAAAGYMYAVSGVSGVNDHASDLFALRRTPMARGDGTYVFEKALRGALDPWVLVDRFGGRIQGGNY
jgi:peptidoglycan/xylan/chitin deacetylase (PgdA/CDA1 family)